MKQVKLDDRDLNRLSGGVKVKKPLTLEATGTAGSMVVEVVVLGM